MANNFDGIKTQKYGLEVELTGITRAKAAKTVAKYLSTEAEYFGGSYDMYKIKDSQNRTWKIMSDASIRCEKSDGTTASKTYSVELVSPICEYDDIETI